MLREDRYFIGLPASASTIILLIISWFEIGFIFILPTVIIIGALMASDIKFPKPGLKINFIAIILIILSLITYDQLYRITPLLLLTAILIYSLGGPIYNKFLTKKK